MPVPPLSRRALLQLGGLGAFALLSACTGGGGDDDGAAGPKGEPDPDIDLLTQALADKQQLLETYEATADAFPGLARQLSPYQLDHAAHRGALARILEQKSGATAPPSPGASTSAVPTAPARPASTDAAIAALATAESAAANRRVGQCRSARDPQLARLLASIGGGEAAHAAVLRIPTPRAGTS